MWIILIRIHNAKLPHSINITAPYWVIYFSLFCVLRLYFTAPGVQGAPEPINGISIHLNGKWQFAWSLNDKTTSMSSGTFMMLRKAQKKRWKTISAHFPMIRPCLEALGSNAQLFPPLMNLIPGPRRETYLCRGDLRLRVYSWLPFFFNFFFFPHRHRYQIVGDILYFIA